LCIAKRCSFYGCLVVNGIVSLNRLGTQFRDVISSVCVVQPRRLEIAVQTDSPVEPNVPVGIMQQLLRLGEGRMHTNGICNIALLHDYPLAFNDENAPPLPVKHSAAGQCNLRSAAQNNFRLRKGGISEDREDAGILFVYLVCYLHEMLHLALAGSLLNESIVKNGNALQT
jgi:hypothetical protein